MMNTFDCKTTERKVSKVCGLWPLCMDYFTLSMIVTVLETMSESVYGLYCFVVVFLGGREL